MSVEILLLITAVVIFTYLFFHSAQVLLAPNSQQGLLSSVCIKPFASPQGGENCFSVELAKTQAQQERGLMYRTGMDKNKGMLFIFDKEAIYPFWMKNTLIPLDIIWIDNNYKAVFISQNVQPCKGLICPTIVPLGPAGGHPAKYVLEINAGIVNEIGLKIGDGLTINIP